MEKKLQETSKLLEKSRSHARKIKQDFERIKKKRFSRLPRPLLL